MLMAYSELVSKFTRVDAGQTGEEILNFFTNMEKLGRPGFFLDFMTHYCTYTVLDVEKHSPIYLDNVLKFMNHPDEALVTKVIKAFNAIMERLSKESQMTQIPLIRRQFEIHGV